MDEKNIFLPVQKHTDRVIVLDRENNDIVADAVLTREEGVLIGIKTADCVPVLLHDPKTGAIGAVHAGWRGTGDGILITAIERMRTEFGTEPADVKIAIGPAIRWCHYEVGPEVFETVLNRTGKGEYYKSRNGQLHLDLPLANKFQALSMGIPDENVWISGECTCCDHENYFSYRRGVREMNHEMGRQGGFIGKMTSSSEK